MEYENAEIIRRYILSIQVCVPKNWTDKQVEEFAEYKHPSGTTLGWIIRKEGDKLLKGMPERNQCESKKDFVHIILDC